MTASLFPSVNTLLGKVGLLETFNGRTSTSVTVSKFVLCDEVESDDVDDEIPLDKVPDDSLTEI